MLGQTHRIHFCFLLVGVLAMTGCGLDPESRVVSQAQEEIESKLLHLNDSWYGYRFAPFPYKIITDLVEMKGGLSIEAEPYEITAADKANGIEWRGDIRILCKVYRTASVHPRGVGEWGKWLNAGPSDTIIGRNKGGVPVFQMSLFEPLHALSLTIRNGQWEWSVKDAPKPTPDLVREADTK